MDIYRVMTDIALTVAISSATGASASATAIATVTTPIVTNQSTSLDLLLANPQSIIDLAERGWSSEWVAEALEGRAGYERLHDLVRYAAERLERESLEDPAWHTFECIIDGPGAVAWLETNRPEIAAMIGDQGS